VSRNVRCPSGEARLTTAGNLDVKFIIHTVGPIYSSAEESAPILEAAYRSVPHPRTLTALCPVRAHRDTVRETVRETQRETDGEGDTGRETVRETQRETPSTRAHGARSGHTSSMRRRVTTWWDGARAGRRCSWRRRPTACTAWRSRRSPAACSSTRGTRRLTSPCVCARR
jgi:hypothetical protein